MERERIWSAVAKEAAKTAAERARYRVVTGNSSSSPVMACGLLLGVFLVFSVVMAIVSAVESFAAAVLSTLAGAAALYVVLFLLALLVCPMIDWLRRILVVYLGRREIASSVRRSPFPRHRYLKNEHCLDSVIWEMIDFDLGRDTVKARRRLGSARSKNRRIDAIAEVRDLLLRDREFFRSWTRRHLVRILRDPHHQPTLTRIYNEMLKRLRFEASGRQQPSQLLEVVGFTMVRAPESLPCWQVTRGAIRLLTWGRLYRQDESGVLVRVDPAEQGREKLRMYLADSERFREFIQRYLFEIMGELGFFEFYLPRVHQQYQAKREKEEHYQPVLVKAVLPQQSQSAQEAEELEVYKRRAAQKAREARRRLRKTKARRKKYLPTSRPETLFTLFQEGRTGVEDDIRALLSHSNCDSQSVDESMVKLQNDRAEFLVFWKTYEDDVLAAHEERVAVEAVLGSEEERERWLEQTIERAVGVHRGEQEKMKAEEHVPVDPEFGYLLAESREQVRQALPEPGLGAMDRYLERELRSRLSQTGARDRFFSDTVRLSLHDCERFRQGSLPHGESVQALGYEPTADRDNLAVTFVEHRGRWRQQFQREAIPIAEEQCDRVVLR